MFGHHFFFSHHQNLGKVFFGDVNVERTLVVFESDIERRLVGADQFRFGEQCFELTAEHFVFEFGGSADEALGFALEACKVGVGRDTLFYIFGFTNVEDVLSVV